MDVKFTIRDIITYFLVGLIGLCCLVISNKSLFDILLKQKEAGFPENGYAFLTILLISFSYVAGHIIQGIDLLRLFASRIIKPSFQKSRFDKFRRIFYFIWFYGRVSHSLYFSNKDFNTFWEKVAFLQVENQYQQSDYEYALKDFFNGLETVCLIFCVYNLASSNNFLFVIFLVCSLLFLVKGKYASECFIDSVETVYTALKKKSADTKPWFH